MATYRELLVRRAELERQLQKTRTEEFTAVVADIKQKMADYSITLVDLGIDPERTNKAGASVPAKYRDPTTGVTWSGRGKAPKWITGEDRDRFVLVHPRRSRRPK
jgi:DNA-binding protein H-NS